MSRKGNCRDNAVAESFFKTLKRELEPLDGNHSAAEVRQPVFLYIEAYYTGFVCKYYKKSYTGLKYISF
jgi:putative transposase